MKTTGFSRVSKENIIAEIEKELKARTIFFVVQHSTVSATALDGLRAKLRKAGTRYLAAKGSLGRKAFERAKLTQFSDSFEGACGIAFSGTDPVAPSKVLVDFAKANEAFKIRSGFLNGELMGADQIKALASLPSREVLLSRVVGGMKTPITKIVHVLAGIPRKLVNVLDALAKKKGASGS